MAHALNLFVPILQDPDSLKLLADIKQRFTTEDQVAIETAARESEIIHFLRVLVLDDKYFVVLTEYDGDHAAYAEFFRQKLPQLFKDIFTLAHGAGAWDQLNNEKAFLDASVSLQKRSLGMTLYGDMDPANQPEGYLFHAYGPKTVKQILAKLG